MRHRERENQGTGGSRANFNKSDCFRTPIPISVDREREPPVLVTGFQIANCAATARLLVVVAVGSRAAPAAVDRLVLICKWWVCQRHPAIRNRPWHQRALLWAGTQLGWIPLCTWIGIGSIAKCAPHSGLEQNLKFYPSWCVWSNLVLLLIVCLFICLFGCVRFPCPSDCHVRRPAPKDMGFPLKTT